MRWGMEPLAPVDEGLMNQPGLGQIPGLLAPSPPPGLAPAPPQPQAPQPPPGQRDYGLGTFGNLAAGAGVDLWKQGTGWLESKLGQGPGGTAMSLQRDYNTALGQAQTPEEKEKVHRDYMDDPRTLQVAQNVINFAGVIGGIRGLKADRFKLANAQAQELQGVHPQKIWEDTGWYRGPESSWKFEMSDQGSGWTPLGEQWLQMSQQLPPGQVFKGIKARDLYNHPELWQNYPDVADIPVRPMARGTPTNEHGAWMPVETHPTGQLLPEEIHLNTARTPDEIRSTFLHELQHPIQQREGFEMGGKPVDIPDPVSPKMREHVDQMGSVLLNLQNKLGVGAADWAASTTPVQRAAAWKRVEQEIKDAGTQLSPVVAQRWKDQLIKDPAGALQYMLKKHDELQALDRPYQKQLEQAHYDYMRRMGEAEPRAVEFRRDWSEARRKAAMPLDSYDYLIRDLLTGAQHAALPEPTAPLTRPMMRPLRP